MIEQIKQVVNRSTAYFVAQDENEQGLALSKESLLYLIGEVERKDDIASRRLKLLEETMKETKELQQALEWASRIIGSGLDVYAPLRYEPVTWLQQYHAEWKEGE